MKTRISNVNVVEKCYSKRILNCSCVVCVISILITMKAPKFFLFVYGLKCAASIDNGFSFGLRLTKTNLSGLGGNDVVL